ncbi:MAG: HPP family protein [Desulfotomaculales bacterium]
MKPGEEVPKQKPFFPAVFQASGSCPARPAPAEMLWSTAGSFLGIGTVTFLAFRYGLPLLVPSFGATAVLVYGAVNSPFAQPRNVVGGHLVSAATGVLVYQLMGSGWLSLTLAVSLAILFMLLTRTVHPPGGATAFVAVWNGQGYLFILTPVLVGAVVLVLIALFVNNIGRNRCYPTYWF